MKSLRPIMIAAIALTPVPAFAQGGSMPDDGGPGRKHQRRQREHAGAGPVDDPATEDRRAAAGAARR